MCSCLFFNWQHVKVEWRATKRFNPLHTIWGAQNIFSFGVHWRRKEGSWGSNANRMFRTGPFKGLWFSCVWDYISRCVWARWNVGMMLKEDVWVVGIWSVTPKETFFGSRFLQYLESQQQHLLEQLQAKWITVIDVVSAQALLARFTLQPHGQTKSNKLCSERP